MKRICYILFYAQILVAGLYIIHLQRLKLQESYYIGKLLQIKEERLIQLDEAIYRVEKLKNPKSLMKKSAELGLTERPIDENYFKEVYLTPDERWKQNKEFHLSFGVKNKLQLAVQDNLDQE